MKASDILSKAADLVGGDRARQHGDKLDNFTKIATMWNAWLTIRRNPGAPLTAHDVGQMMALMKKARTQSGSYNPDDYIDDAGYTGATAEIAHIIEGPKSEEFWRILKSYEDADQRQVIWPDEPDPLASKNG